MRAIAPPYEREANLRRALSLVLSFSRRKKEHIKKLKSFLIDKNFCVNDNVKKIKEGEFF